MENGMNENSPYKFHGLTSLAKITRKNDRTINLYCLQHTNDVKKLVGCKGTITLHHQILLTMLSGKIPQLDWVICVASDRHMSIAAMT